MAYLLPATLKKEGEEGIRKRRATILLVGALLLTTVAGVALAKTFTCQPGSTKEDSCKGTKKADQITGTDGSDYIVGKRGKDTLHGGTGTGQIDIGDVIHGNAGADYRPGRQVGA
jgi:Ca2+-binding RTX toxin-like protein